MTDTPFQVNFEFRNKELRTAPRFKSLLPHPINDGPIRGLTTFVDSNNVTHTVSITANNLWQLVYRSSIPDDTKWIWNKIGAFNTNGSDNQFAVQIYLNKIYFTNGSLGIYSWDGITNGVSEVTNSGGLPLYGAYFLQELGSHLIAFNTIEYNVVTGTAVNFPQRVRWTPSGLPTVWDPSVNSAAGFTDMLEVPDAITGALTIGQKIYIYRTNGVTQMSLTGLAAQPFQFDHMWASDRGIGNVYPQTAATYGPVGIFISSEDIYRVTPISLEAIGGNTRDAIFDDLAQATGAAVGTIIQGLHKTYIYVTYRLVIPMGNNCVLWTYSLEDKNWMRRFLNIGVPTTRMRICTTK